MHFIPIGPSCHAAGNLNMLKLRKQALPFDWLLCNPSDRIFEYVNDLINTNYNLVLPEELYKFKHFKFDKYIRNQSKCKVYGNPQDFKQLLSRNIR